MLKTYLMIATSALGLHAGGISAQETDGVDPASVSAPVGNDATFDEIVVTARKRSEGIQSVPISVTAVNDALITRNNITSISQVTLLAPNVTIVPISISPTQAAPFIRGVGNTSQEPTQDPPIAISIDGVYIAQLAGSLLDVFDAQSIEVLRGPQGALQGRNSPGGAINLTTRRPGNEYGARAEFSYGNYNEVQIKAAVDGPIVEDKVAVKAALFYSDRDGYVHNVINDTDISDSKTIAGRVGLLLTPTEDLSWYITGDYVDAKLKPVGLRYVVGESEPGVPSLACLAFEFCTPANRRESLQNYLGPNSQTGWGITSNLDYDLGFADLISVTGYRKVRDLQSSDVDGTPASLFNVFERRNRTTQFSQELRLASNTGSGAAGEFDWVFGLYYLNSKFSLDDRQQAGAAPPASKYRNQTLNSYAAFGQVTYHITDAWSVSAGGRQSWDNKDLNVRFFGADTYVPFSAKFKNLSIEAGTEYRISSDVFTYLRFSQGYRSGGLNGGANDAAGVLPYNPEKVNAYEAGIKSEWFDRMLLANLTAFQYNYDNIQRNSTLSDGEGGLIDFISNQGKARIRGVEADIGLRPSRNLNIRTSVGYLDAQNRDAGKRGIAIPYTPKVSITTSADWTVPFDNGNSLVFSGDVGLKSKYNVNVDGASVGEQKSYIITNASIKFNITEKFSISAYGNNLFNVYYINNAETLGGLASWVVEGTPRTYGMRLTARY